ncbi:hypothetical protein BKA70DRAFT_1459996 [Coprinopsis sp. MPI-PUGE-AT-0042]|nr:hypothetical protein BKA70DRAFT_1459996 [Coprinopsis sp. MPI-PUGE-AT-0042]
MDINIRPLKRMKLTTSESWLTSLQPFFQAIHIPFAQSYRDNKLDLLLSISTVAVASTPSLAALTLARTHSTKTSTVSGVILEPRFDATAYCALAPADPAYFHESLALGGGVSSSSSYAGRVSVVIVPGGLRGRPGRRGQWSIKRKTGNCISKKYREQKRGQELDKVQEEAPSTSTRIKARYGPRASAFDEFFRTPFLSLAFYALFFIDFDGYTLLVSRPDLDYPLSLVCLFCVQVTNATQ